MPTERIGIKDIYRGPGKWIIKGTDCGTYLTESQFVAALCKRALEQGFQVLVQWRELRFLDRWVTKIERAESEASDAA